MRTLEAARRRTRVESDARRFAAMALNYAEMAERLAREAGWLRGVVELPPAPAAGLACRWCPDETWANARGLFGHTLLEHPRFVRASWTSRFGRCPVDLASADVWSLTEPQADALLATLGW